MKAVPMCDDALHRAIERYSTMVYRLAYARTHNRADAEDIYQEVFLKLYTQNPDFESEAHRKAWLLRVTANCSVNLFRSAWRRCVQLMDRPPERRPEGAPPGEDRLPEALERLPKRYRTVVHLYYCEDMSIDEIARLLGEKPSTLRSRLSRALQMLKRMLNDEEAK